MTILAISDHVDPRVYSLNIKPRFNQVDLVISAGDLDLAYCEYVVSCLNKPLYFVFGNHNLNTLPFFRPKAVDRPSPGAGEGMVTGFGSRCVDGSVVRDRDNNLIIAGLGGCRRYNNGENQYTEIQMLIRILKLIPRMAFFRLFYGRWVDILVAHASPAGIHDRDDPCHRGFQCFLWFIRRFKPRYLIHGHVHLYDINASRQSQFYHTTILNAYDHILVDWERGMKESSYVESQAEQDFNKAKLHAWIDSLRGIVHSQAGQLLAFHDIKNLVKPGGERYLGMKAVPIASIVGSEDRYRDFSHHFFPKREHLRNRWKSIDRAYLSDVILPPIKLLKIGDLYFVRDGNHRVSVALSQGMYSIDAEVIELTTELHIKLNATRDDILKAVLEWERRRILNQTGLESIIPVETIEFTAPGRWHELLNHIEGHKYYLSLEQNKEVTFQDAARSWYDSLYISILKIVRNENILPRFPGRTEADLYIWIIKHWHSLKEQYGSAYPLDKAASEYAASHGKDMPYRWIRWMKRLFGR